MLYLTCFTVTSTKDGILVDDAFEPQLLLGQDIEGTINDEPAEGDGLVLTGDFKNSKTSGLSVAYLGDGTGSAGAVTVAQNALKFQSGTSTDEQIKVALNSTHSTVLGRGVDNVSGFENLSQIRLTSTHFDSLRLTSTPLSDHSTIMRQLLCDHYNHYATSAQ